MSPSAWKFGLPLSVNVKSDMYRPLSRGSLSEIGRGEGRPGWKEGGRGWKKYEMRMWNM